MRDREEREGRKGSVWEKKKEKRERKNGVQQKRRNEEITKRRYRGVIGLSTPRVSLYSCLH